MNSDRLVALLYFIMRDEIPSGVLVEYINSIKNYQHFNFTNKHLEAMAREYAERILAENYKPNTRLVL